MTREEAIKNIKEHCYFANLIPQAKEALDMAIKALEQDPCGDAISRQEVLALAKEECDTAIIPYRRFVKDVNALPPVTPQPKMGRWISYSWNDNGIARWGIKCDQCYKEYRYGGEMGGTYKFCPNCGQPKMQEVGE